MPPAVRHALPVDHGIVAQHDFLAVDLEHANGRLDDKSVRHRRLRPVFVVVAGQQMDTLADNAFAQLVGILDCHLKAKVAQDVELIIRSNLAVNVGDHGVVHLHNSRPRPIAKP